MLTYICTEVPGYPPRSSSSSPSSSSGSANSAAGNSSGWCSKAIIAVRRCEVFIHARCIVPRLRDLTSCFLRHALSNEQPWAYFMTGSETFDGKHADGLLVAEKNRV